jgi:hypothetical protein
VTMVVSGKEGEDDDDGDDEEDRLRNDENA